MLEQLQKRIIPILRWSEKYTKTDMVYLAHGGFWLAFAQGTISIFGFVLTTLLANILEPELLGEYRFLISGFTLVSLCALPGMRTALRESTPKGFRGNLVPAFNAMFKWGILGSLISLGVMAYYFANDNASLALGFLIMALALPFYNASTGYIEYLTALKEYRLTTLYTFIGRLTFFATTAIVAFLFPHYAWALFGAFIFGTLIPNVWLHFKTVRTFTTPEDAVDPGITTYAGHITAMTFVGAIAGQFDKMFLWSFIGAEALAIFYIAYTIPLAVSQYLVIVPTLAFAKFGERDPRIIRKTLLPKIWKYFFIIMLGMGAYALAAPYIFAVLYPKYGEAIRYAQALALVPLFSAFLPIKTYLTSIKATKELYMLSITPSVFRLGLALVLIVPFGIWGAIFSLLAEGVVHTTLLLYFFIRSPKE